MQRKPEKTLWDEMMAKSPIVYRIGREYDHRRGEFKAVKGTYHNPVKDLEEITGEKRV